jgi:hypothetical protein
MTQWPNTSMPPAFLSSSGTRLFARHSDKGRAFTILTPVFFERITVEIPFMDEALQSLKKT